MSPATDIERVTFVIVSEVLGGGELFALRLAKALGAKCAVAIAGLPGTPVMIEADKWRIQTEPLELGHKLGRRTALRNVAMLPLARRRLRQFVNARSPREWIVFQYSWEKLLWDGRSKGARVAVLEHARPPTPLLQFGVTRRLFRDALVHCDALFAVGGPAAEALECLSGRKPTIVGTGVDPSMVEQARLGAAETRAELGIGDAPLLVYAGRLAENKGVFDLVAAAARNHRLHLLLLGEGPAESGLRAAASAFASRLLMPGRIENVLPYLAAADLTGLLTRDPGEGRPQLAVESIAVGTPVVGSAGSPAMTMLATDSGEGIVLVETSPEAIDEGIGKALAMNPPQVKTPSWETVAAEFMTELGSRG